MRLIGHLESEDDVKRLIFFLKQKGIETSYDGFFDANTGHMSYQLWGYEEDQVIDAKKEFDRFLKDPSHSMYDVPIPETPHPEEQSVENTNEKVEQSFFPFTAFMIALCGLIFILNFIEEISAKQQAEKGFVLTDVQMNLFYDLPPALNQLGKIVEKYDIAPDMKIKDLPPDAIREIQALEKLPYWKGIYNWILLKLQGENTLLAEGPLFEKIREGQFWRVFTPAILHVGFLHILFNMIWVWILSKPIEKRIGVLKLLLLTLILAIGSNTAQYLMGGPFFLGYSGVVMGLAGFTWAREKQAPWEGYPMQKGTLLFLGIYVAAMFFLQLVSFILQIFTTLSFSPNIANTAHIVGGVLGAICGRFAFFAERIKLE